MPDHVGWLLDLYEDEREGVVLWLIGDDGERCRLRQDFPITFYAAGDPEQLRDLQRYLRTWPEKLHLYRAQRRDLFHDKPLTLLAVEMGAPIRQPRLFQQITDRFPDLDYYDADLKITLRHAARWDTFPLARCSISADDEGVVRELRVLDSPWDLDPFDVPLRVLSLEPDCDPTHARPSVLTVCHHGREYRFSLQPE